MRQLIKLTSIALILTAVNAFAEEPNNPEDAFLYHSRRPDASGDASGSLIRASVFTGAAEASIPIEVPRGTAGVQPSLALTFNSRRDRGNAGRGWSLEISKIARSTKNGADLAQTLPPLDAALVYVLDGEELVMSATVETDPYGCSSRRFYRKTETFGGFEKILFCNSTDYWTVLEPNGTRRTYGKDTGTRLRSGSTSMEYYLHEVQDTHGISWKATYSLYGSPNPSSAPRLELIEYPFLGGAPLGPTREVDIVYEDWLTEPTCNCGRPATIDYRYGLALSYDQRIAHWA